VHKNQLRHSKKQTTTIPYGYSKLASVENASIAALDKGTYPALSVTPPFWKEGKGDTIRLRFGRQKGSWTRANKGSYKGADKSLARPTSRCILFDGESISFDASLVLYT